MQRWVRSNIRYAAITPERDAQEAASRGKWALIGWDEPFGTSRAGVDCNRPTAYRVDDMQMPCTMLKGDQSCEMQARVSDYTLRFNRSLVTQAAYPYRDICRIKPVLEKQSPDVGAEVSQLGFPDLQDVGRPRDVFEAARRGHILFLQAAYRTAPASIQARDLFNMTVAEWAVRYRHTEAVKWLVSHGAAKADRACDNIQTNPLLLRAIMTGQDDLALWLSNAMPTKIPWSSWQIEEAARRNMPHILAKMLREPNEGIRFNTPAPPFALLLATRTVLDQALEKLCKITGVYDDTIVDVLDIDLRIDVNKPGSNKVDIVYPNSRSRVLVLLNGDNTELRSVWAKRPGALRVIRIKSGGPGLSWPGGMSPPLDFIFENGLTTACPPTQRKIDDARSGDPKNIRAAIAAVFGKVPIVWHSVRNNSPVQLAK